MMEFLAKLKKEKKEVHLPFYTGNRFKQIRIFENDIN